MSLLHFPLRTAGFVGLTLTMYSLLELDTALSATADRAEVLHNWIERYGRGLLRLYGVEVIAEGRHVAEGYRYPGKDDRGLGRIFVMNHRSGLDVPLSLAFVEATIVSRADLARWPVIGMAARRVGTLFVDRESKNSGAAVIAAMCGAIERGRGVMVYPEGTTFAGDEVRPLRPGALVAAQRTGAEVIPIGIAYAGSGASFVSEPFVAHMKRVSMTPKTKVALVVGEPVSLDRSNVDAMRSQARDAIQSLVNRARVTCSRPT